MSQSFNPTARSIPVVLTILFLMTGNVFAAPQLKVLGFADNSCEAWFASSDDADLRKTYVAWARGFLTGHNYANQKQQVTDVSSSTVETYIERFCKSKPKSLFNDAVFRMSDEYSGRAAPILK